jgi:RHS repeat-associated protein
MICQPDGVFGRDNAYVLSKTRGSATDAYAQVTTSATYDFNSGLGLSATDANGRQSQTSYDSSTLRPTTSTSPTGAHTDFAYDDSAMTVTSTTYLASGEGGGIADQSVKFLNGAGQARREKARGPDSGGNQTWDAVDTIYNNLGQAYQQSRPYRLGVESPVYNTLTYDALGRTKTVTAPDGSVTQTFYSEASRPDAASSTAGETTRVQDAWGRERWGRTDSSGRLVEVVEPNPSGNGSVATSGLVTTYAYNTLGNLITVSQGAQTRSFAYDSLGRLTAQKLAETSATLNSTGTYVGAGTWSDVFAYDSRSNLTSRTDARGVKTVYTYSSDPLNRLQSVSWDTSGFGDTANPIASAATISYSYRTKTSQTDVKDVTQLSSVTAAGVSTESYEYDTEGRVYTQTVTLASRSSYPFVTTYSYDSLDRATDVRYPAEYGNGSAPRKVVHHDYDIASRLTGLTYDGQSFASSIVYNAASQTTSLNVGNGTNQIAENYSYNAQTGLLENQTVARGATTLLSLSYDYAGANGKRTGQLTKILNNLNHNKDRGYSYDALGRLVQATGGPSSSPLSTQTYSYDRYGNRTSVTASGYSAKNGDAGSAGVSPALSAQNRRGSGIEPGAVATGLIAQLSDPKGDPPTDLLAKNTSVSLLASARDDGRPVSDSAPSLRAPAPPQSGPPTFTDPDLLASGGVQIKALHVTELRTAINNLRARLGLSAYTWTKPVATGGVVQSGGLITADPIIEMRTALDEALGAPSPGYAAGLAQNLPILAIHIQELRNRVVAGWTVSSQIPRDGLASVSYDTSSNRITTAGFAYDAVGNQTRAIGPSGSSSQRFKYDAANRLVQVLADNNATVIATYTYGDSNERLISDEGGYRTYYASEGGTVIAEYTESGSSTTPSWSKSYVYLGARLLSNLAPNGSGGEAAQYHHPDRLGTRLVTDPSNGTSFEQVTLPFGTSLNAESTGATNRRFTSYDRSVTTGLDYAVNRHYDSQQGRFTQVDPAGLKATSLENPQTLNLYGYVANDPVNRMDPSGMFWGALKRFFHKVGAILSAVAAVVGRILNNRWVRIGVFILEFILPGLGGVLETIVEWSLKIYDKIAEIVSFMQLGGMALQGKWREFGLSVAMGMVSAMLTMVTSQVQTQVQHSLWPKNGDPQAQDLWDIFQNAVQGLHDGLVNLRDTIAHAFEDFPRNLIPWYGNYCSSAATGSNAPGSGINGADDGVCRPHDVKYQDNGSITKGEQAKGIFTINDRRRAADFSFFKRALFGLHSPSVTVFDIAFSGQHGGRPLVGGVYFFFAIPGIGGLGVLRKF